MWRKDKSFSEIEQPHQTCFEQCNPAPGKKSKKTEIARQKSRVNSPVNGIFVLEFSGYNKNFSYTYATLTHIFHLKNILATLKKIF